MNTRHGYHTTPASRSMPPAQYPFPSQPQAPAPMIVETPRIHRRARYRGHLLLELSIARRLTLGFFIAALLAASVTGIIGLLRVQTLDKQSSFYRNVLQVNTKLNTGANFLQLMNAEVHVMLDAAAQPHPSQETLKTDQQALENLTNQYNSILTDYITHDLLNKHADQAALLNEAGHADQVARQITLAGSALRSWQVYRTAQTQVISDISSGNLGTSQHLEQVHGEPTHADALSALNSLIQFNGRLASYVQGAAQV
ncbi:MAG: hypothetical protein J2P36_04375, partial [Ktedonobacteraceae bacterium]|nr:hypothetical protein [Ktedonobacteraceae bacterium]